MVSQNPVAVFWAEAVQEPKVHVVGAVIALVGEDGMRLLTARATDAFTVGGAAPTLGGCFMIVLKTTSFQDTTLYAKAKEMSGENAWQRMRNIRSKMKKRTCIT